MLRGLRAARTLVQRLLAESDRCIACRKELRIFADCIERAVSWRRLFFICCGIRSTYLMAVAFLIAGFFHSDGEHELNGLFQGRTRKGR